MALTRSIGAYDDGTVLVPGVGTTPLDTRKSLSALWASAGVVSGGPSPLVTGTAGFAYQVAGPVPFVTTRGVSDGFQMFTNDGAVTVPITNAAGVTLTGAPGSGLQRIDILWVQHRTNDENSDTTSEPRFGVESGTAVSSSPAPPSIPTGALELARNTMTSAATSTASAGNTIAPTAAVAGLRATVGIGTVLTASVTVGGTAGSTGADLWVPAAGITLTPGTWLVQAACTVNNATVQDQATCSVRNTTASTEIAASRGAPATTFTGTVFTALTSLLYPMTVTANTAICPNGHPNGGSTLNMSASNMAGAPNAWITALRIA